MKRMLGLYALTAMLFFCLGTANADQGKIEQLIKDYEAALNQKDLPALRALYFKDYMEISFDRSNKMYSGSSVGDGVFKGLEKYLRTLRSYKASSLQITVLKNIAYVQCDESQTMTTSKNPLTYKTMITCVKSGERWYIAMQSSQEVE